MNILSPEILDAYKNAPLIDERALPSYRALQSSILPSYMKILENGLKVFYVNKEPYTTPQEMFQDLEHNKLKVSMLHNEHPLFTPDENLRFRAVHDYYHWQAQALFDGAGEYLTYLYHAKEIPAEAHEALYSEVVIQAEYFLQLGVFPVQKVITLSQLQETL